MRGFVLMLIPVLLSGSVHAAGFDEGNALQWSPAEFAIEGRVEYCGGQPFAVELLPAGTVELPPFKEGYWSRFDDSLPDAVDEIVDLAAGGGSWMAIIRPAATASRLREAPITGNWPLGQIRGAVLAQLFDEARLRHGLDEATFQVELTGTTALNNSTTSAEVLLFRKEYMPLEVVSKVREEKVPPAAKNLLVFGSAGYEGYFSSGVEIAAPTGLLGAGFRVSGNRFLWIEWSAGRSSGSLRYSEVGSQGIFFDLYRSPSFGLALGGFRSVAKLEESPSFGFVKRLRGNGAALSATLIPLHVSGLDLGARVSGQIGKFEVIESISAAPHAEWGSGLTLHLTAQGRF